jgi:hypothetical protein
MRKAFSGFFTKEKSCTGNAAFNKENITVLKPEWW